MSWSIICDARKGHSLGISVLAMSTRRNSWTSDSSSSIRPFSTETEAKSVANQLRFNNPRVVTYACACNAINAQGRNVMEAEREADHQYALDASEAGWDGHKH